MYKLGLILFACMFFACKDKKAEVKEEKGFNYEGFSKSFLSSYLPYQLTDTGLSKSKDTALIRSPEFAGFISDSVRNKIFSRGSKARYYSLLKIQVPKAETYFLVKAVSGSKKAALLICFDADGKYAATLPFLVPDEDASTSQSSTIDKSFTISRNITKKKGSEVIGEGKDVYVYNSDAKQFTLIMTDALDQQNADLVNPIDTLPRTRKFAGDYVQGKKNLISIRDGRTANQAIAFVHLEKNDGQCIGELKGELLFTSSKTAVYRQGGDPCVLQFSFTNSSVALREEQGCGNHRGLDCALEGTYSKKKETKPKPPVKKSRKK
jgi:hypothetical protein